ncbi:hypothetical protein cyc_02578 [Cyclospora cayetanensis]|uniref:Uncharacterized protein n=1 Tax=Cyclospora cayetanensis TaxID=88456 RepID=A0A1D3CYU9_9EIME|nr:hypothetical protein cyc_02578 [Cyclospora cayetanensis]
MAHLGRKSSEVSGGYSLFEQAEEHQEAAVGAVVLQQAADLARNLPAFIRVDAFTEQAKVKRLFLLWAATKWIREAFALGIRVRRAPVVGMQQALQSLLYSTLVTAPVKHSSDTRAHLVVLRQQDLPHPKQNAHYESVRLVHRQHWSNAVKGIRRLHAFQQKALRCKQLVRCSALLQQLMALLKVWNYAQYKRRPLCGVWAILDLRKSTQPQQPDKLGGMKHHSIDLH